MLARVRRGSVIQLVAIALVAGLVATAVALFIPWLPVAAGEEADRIHFVYWFTTAICIGVFAVVAAVLGYSIWKFRVKPDDFSDGPPTHGHTQLEIIWTAIPAILVTAISIVSAIVLAQNSRAGDNPLVVKVVAQQFAWTFTYPNGKTYGYLTIPKGRHTKLDITANDVIHSFWVPELSQKQDAVPGEHNNLIVTPDAHRQLPGHLHRALRPRPRRHAEPRRDPGRRGVRHAGSRAAARQRVPRPVLRSSSRRAAAAATRSSRRARTATSDPTSTS